MSHWLPNPLGSLLPKPRAAETLLFVHVPKAAGSTVRQALEATFGARQIFVADPDTHRAATEFTNLSHSRRRRVRLILGHMPFGMHQYLTEPFSYFTVLRHPVDRMISHYYYVLQSHDHYLHKMVVERQMSLEAYCTADINIEFDNDQVRLISGLRDTIPMGRVGEEHLRLAIENIELYFGVVGVQDDLSGFNDAFEARYGVNIARVGPKNVTKDRPRLGDVSPTIRSEILARSQWDMRLYEYAQHRILASKCKRSAQAA